MRQKGRAERGEELDPSFVLGRGPQARVSRWILVNKTD